MNDPGNYMEDIVIEIKMRLSGLTYDEAKKVRDALRQPNDLDMYDIVETVSGLAKDIAPHADIEIFSPWAEWRPAQGKRQKRYE